MSFNLDWYMDQEDEIAASDVDSIHGRWLYGLRLLRDPEAFAPGSSQLKPGRADMLTKGAKARGRKLSGREIRYRLQAARAYSYESQIRQASAEFPNWWGLISADFPAYEPEPGEPVADHRTLRERKRDQSRANAAAARAAGASDEQLALFPLDQFERDVVTLKELNSYAVEMAELTERFAKRDRQRRAYLDAMIAAVGGDLSATWLEADEALRDLTDATSDLRVVAA